LIYCPCGGLHSVCCRMSATARTDFRKGLIVRRRHRRRRIVCFAYSWRRAMAIGTG
jgi:hypothetical protein